ncbi:MAG TPA: DUF262 domain-containing protein [candidate division Zixibacteria bacterium]
MKVLSDHRELDKIYKRRDRYEIPDWQRQEVWGTSKKQRLIDTILRGWKLPKFYFQKVSDEPAYHVVDGQQRLTAIFEFIDNELELADESAKRFGGRLYRDLPDVYVDAIDDFKIDFDEIEDATDEEVKEYFQRLQGGLQLTGSEKLNSVHSKLREFIVKALKHPIFGRIGASNRRYGHFDILAKVTAVEIDGLEVGLRYDDLLAVFEGQSGFSTKSNIAGRIRRALDFADSGFGDRASSLRNRTVVQSLLTLVCRLIQSPGIVGREKDVANFYLTFLDDVAKQVQLGQRATDTLTLEFQRTITANVRSGAKVRQQILLRKLLTHDPTFIDDLDPTAVAEAGLKGAVNQLASEIVDSVARINELYASKHGENLFQPTNRTAKAQEVIRTPIHDLASYDNFVKHLYFLVWESTGTRQDESRPPVFADIRDLRTDLDHDVEHGKPSKIRGKKKKIASAFEKYSGASSPLGIDPERFIVVQSNILSALCNALNALPV